MRARPVLLSLLFCTFVACPPTQTNAAAKPNLLGSKVENFSLRDLHGHPKSLADFQNRKVIVLAFVGCDCPLVKIYMPRLIQLSKEYEAKGVQFVGVNSNLQDTPTEIARWSQSFAVPFPVLKDAGNTLADKLGAERTPQVVVLDAARNIRYRGRIDDQFSVGAHRQKAKNRELATAIDELLADKAVSTPETDATGCAIGRVPKVEPHGDVTYSNQISRILNARCVECHRTGELAPFPLNTYHDVIGWADMMREVIDQGRMPPWFADPKHGKFSNDCSMPADEKKLFGQWVDNGCPEGDRRELPLGPEFSVGWRMGTPDSIYEMSEPFTVPAEGVLDYKYFVIDPKFTEDKWVTVAEARPGNPSVVHHVVLYAIPPGVDISRPERAQAEGQMIAIYAPGMPPWKYPEGAAMKVAKGSTFFIQMHYTPNGQEQQDRSLVGLRFLDPAKVKKKVTYGMAVNMGFEIPPHADNYEVSTKVKFSRDMLLLNLFPHMHFRGKSFRFDAVYPDGTTEVLLDVPRYDFNWQLRYDLAEPKLLPKGTTLLCTGHFDNSENNPGNPDPDKKVRFGLQTFEEMLVGYYTVVRAEEDLTRKKK